jgi:hypothetical protein
MTVTEFLKTHHPEKYILTDRMGAPITEDWLKWMNPDDTLVRKHDVLSDGTYRIQTDYMQDAC